MRVMLRKLIARYEVLPHLQTFKNIENVLNLLWHCCEYVGLAKYTFPLQTEDSK